jgi:DNA-binding NarL/FixJ family response regulator
MADVRNGSGRKRILIVYRSGILGRGLQRMLGRSRSFQLVGMHCDLAAALHALRSLRPDVVLLEVTPELNPWTPVQMLYTLAPTGRVITVNTENSEVTAIEISRPAVTWSLTSPAQLAQMITRTRLDTQLIVQGAGGEAGASMHPRIATRGVDQNAGPEAKTGWSIHRPRKAAGFRPIVIPGGRL